MSTEPMSGAPSPAPLSQRDQLLAILPWWIWFVGLAAFFVQDLHPLAKRHAFWGMGYNLALSVLFGCCPLLFMIISRASGSDALRSLSTLGGLAAFCLAFLLWAGVALLNTYAVLQNKGPWLQG
ncbi:hypothetical protein [Thermoflexus sp.]|jgi:hypothetical protein|uniref:hypothetical protein n=1 Tax=Thermoflexus sp. TaxID=1969742 RepID=UPI003C01A856